MAKRNSEFFRNDIPADQIAQAAFQLIEQAGDPAADYDYVTIRAGRGWCVAEIARGHVMKHYPKGSLPRRQLLTAMSRLGAPNVGGL